MLTLFAWERFGLLLVVVPTDALRTQIAGKFQTMGLLGPFGVLAEGALLPVVGVLEHAFGSADEASDLIRRCNVVVATMAVLDACSPDARDRIAGLCPCLFIDEAHHGAAHTRQEFRTLFLKRPRNRALQFMATPHREDGRLVDGRVVFSYPLRKARAAGYFSGISQLGHIRDRKVGDLRLDRQSRRMECSPVVIPSPDALERASVHPRRRQAEMGEDRGRDIH